MKLLSRKRTLLTQTYFDTWRELFTSKPYLLLNGSQFGDLVEQIFYFRRLCIIQRDYEMHVGGGAEIY